MVPHMNTPQRRRWLMIGVVLLVVFLSALHSHMERFTGWGLLVLIFLVGAGGALAYEWARGQLLLAWNRLPKRQRLALVCAAIALFLGGTFVIYRGKPDADFNNFVTRMCVCLALILWGLYRIVSRVLDALWARFSKRRD